jgi:hypothetical protein
MFIASGCAHFGRFQLYSQGPPGNPEILHDPFRTPECRFDVCTDISQLGRDELEYSNILNSSPFYYSAARDGIKSCNGVTLSLGKSSLGL